LKGLGRVAIAPRSRPELSTTSIGHRGCPSPHRRPPGPHHTEPIRSVPRLRPMMVRAVKVSERERALPNLTYRAAYRMGSYSPEIVRSSTLPSRASNMLPPLCLIGLASGIADCEPSTSLRVGPTVHVVASVGPRRRLLFSCFRCCCGPAFAGRYLRCNPALRREAFDIFDHFDLGMAESLDQLAGFIGGGVPNAGRIILPRFFRLLAQGYESTHAFVRWTSLRLRPAGARTRNRQEAPRQQNGARRECR
jgi:hypothetical protein